MSSIGRNPLPEYIFHVRSFFFSVFCSFFFTLRVRMFTPTKANVGIFIEETRELDKEAEETRYTSRLKCAWGRKMEPRRVLLLSNGRDPTYLRERHLEPDEALQLGTKRIWCGILHQTA